MIKVFLRGGLGNQMFQYSLGFALAKKNATGLILDTTYLNDRFPRPGNTFRKFDMDIFTMRPRFTVLSKISSMAPIPGVWLGLDLAWIEVEKMLGVRKFVKEKNEHGFDANVMHAGKNAVLWGFWQSPKYFADIESDLRKEFKLKYQFEGKALEIANAMRASNSISLHVRRADYLLPKYAATYGDTNLSYYQDAVRYMADRVKDPHFFIVSDDIAWCKENFKFPFPMTFLEKDSAGPKQSFHLALMAECRHHIIANSSFSWWGAWLDPRPDKIVVAPKQWQANPLVLSNTVVPESWIIL